MDWQNVTAEELVDALREVDWKAPRPVSEFFQKFSPPKNYSKWTSRVKCNVYYYRTNYLILFVTSFLLVLLTNPIALAGVFLCTVGALCMNDPFATSVNDALLKVVRRIHPRTALKLRAQAGQQEKLAPPRKSRRRIYVVGAPREAVVAVLALSGAVLLYLTAGVLTLLWAILAAIGLPLLHATLRSPNLKARLASAREEFRAVWRGYQADNVHDYTL